MEKRIAAPIDKENVRTLIAGDYVYITAVSYTHLTLPTNSLV